MSVRIVNGKLWFLIAIHYIGFIIQSVCFQLQFCYKGKNCYQLNDYTFEHKWTNELQNKLTQTTSLVVTHLKLSQENYIKLFSQRFPNLKQIQFRHTNQNPQFQTMRITNVLTPKIVQTIFMSSYFSQLQLLDLTLTNLDFRHFQFMEKTNMLINSNLKHLILNQNFIEKKALALIRNIRFSGKLETLQLAGNSLIQYESIQSISNMIQPQDQGEKATLKKLNLHSSSLTPDNLILLLQNIDSSKLQHLDIGHHAFQHSKNYQIPFNNTIYDYLLNSDFSSLKTLNLSYLDLDEQQLPFLQKMKTPLLQVLDIGKNFITNDYFKKWITVQKMPQLKSLGLSKNSITDDAIKLLINQNFSKLQTLDISRNRRLSPNHLKHLQKINSSQLKSLDISWNSANENSLRQFFENRQFENLQSLIIQGFANGKKLFQYIDWESMINLEVIELFETDLSYSLQVIEKDNITFPDLKVLKLGGQWLNKTFMDWFVNRLTLFAPQLQLFQVKISGQQARGGYFNFSNLRYEKIPNNCLLKSIEYMTIYKPLKGHKFELIDMIFTKRQDTLLHEKNFMKDVTFFGGNKSDKYQTYQQSNDNKNEDAARIFQFLYDFVDFRTTETISSDYPGILKQFVRVLEEQDLRQSLVKESGETPSQLFKNQVYYPYLRIFFYKPQSFEYDPQLLSVLNKLKAPLLNLLSFVGDPNQPDDKRFQVTNQILSKNQNLQMVIFISSDLNCKNFDQLIKAKKFTYLLRLSLLNTQVKSQCLDRFIKDHQLIRQLYVRNSSGLAEGFFEQVLIKHQLIIENMMIGEIQFADQQFSKFSKVNREFLLELHAQLVRISSDGLKWLSGNVTQGFLFPKIVFLNIQNNFFNEDGPKALFKHGLVMIQRIILWPMTDLMVNAEILKYPTRLKFYNMYSGHFDELQAKFDLRSLRHVEDLHLQSPYAYFEKRDFEIVSEINLERVLSLQISFKDVYECEALKSLLTIMKYVSKIQIYMDYSKNGNLTLKDSCLQKYSRTDQSYMYHLRSLKVNILHQKIYIPKFYTYLYSTNKEFVVWNLTQYELTDLNMNDLFSRIDLEEKVYLDLRKNFITDAFLDKFFLNPLNKLKLLALNQNYIELKNVKSLIGKTFPSLEYFFLPINELTDNSIDLIVQAHYPKLLELSLEGNAISLKGFLKLLEIDAPLLNVIYLTSTLITEEDLVYIVQYVDLHKFPNLKDIKTNTRVREINSQRIQSLLHKKYPSQNLKITYIKYYLTQNNKAVLKI